MKHPLKIAGALLGAAFLLGASVLPVSAAREFPELNSYCTVYDIEDAISADEEKMAAQRIQETCEKIDMYVAVYIVGEETPFSSDQAVERFADDAYDKLFNPVDGKDTDGVLLVINDSTKYDYLTTSGTAQMYFENSDGGSRTWTILETITPNLKNKDYVGAISTFCAELEAFYKQGIPNGAFSYDSSTGEYYYYHKGQLQHAKKLPWWFGKNLGLLGGIAAICGAVAAFIASCFVKSSYHLVKSISPTNYVSEQESKYSVHEDHFLREHVARVHIDSGGGGRTGGGGGGGGHSHMSSGGHSHGGGGHHR